MRRKLSRHPSWVTIIVVVALLIYVLVALGARKEAVFNVGLCEEHRRRRKKFMLVSSLTGVGGLVMLAACFAAESIELGIAGGVVAVASFLVATVGSQMISAARITDRDALIKGCGSEFLLSLG